ncbi:MAG: hypothetical protein OXH83_20540 [Bryobacterales bacterium]|nr:hypothetical protein [Bryobacterales bacterium]
MSVEGAGQILKAALRLFAWGQSCVERPGPSRDKVCGGLAGGFLKDRDRKLGAEMLGSAQDRDGGIPA